MIRCVELESEGGFEIGMEIVPKADFSGFRVTEIPCVWMERDKGKSRFKITAVRLTLEQYQAVI